MGIGQKERYEQGGIGRKYWDYRDQVVLGMLGDGPTLDAGCGEMITTRKIPGAIGMDIDQGDVRGSVYKMPFKDESFGTVVFSEVIEHLAEPELALDEIRRVLKDGGKVIVVFPNDRAFKLAWFVCGMWGEINRDRGHVRQWTPKEARKMLEGHGFEVKEGCSIPFMFWPISLHHVVVGEKC
jgi:SAM-dependent methyltransferase